MPNETNRDDKAREQVGVIEEWLAKARLAYINEAHAMTLTNDREKLKTLAMRREAIEAAEYALKCAPAQPAQIGRLRL